MDCAILGDDRADSDQITALPVTGFASADFTFDWRGCRSCQTGRWHRQMAVLSWHQPSVSWHCGWAGNGTSGHLGGNDIWRRDKPSSAWFRLSWFGRRGAGSMVWPFMDSPSPVASLFWHDWCRNAVSYDCLFRGLSSLVPHSCFKRNCREDRRLARRTSRNCDKRLSGTVIGISAWPRPVAS